MNEWRLSSIFLFLSILVYIGSIYPGLYGYKSQYSQFILVSYNVTDTQNTYSLKVEKNGVKIYKDGNYDFLNSNVEIIYECSYSSVIESGNCDGLPIPNIGRIENYTLTIRSLYIFICVFPIVFTFLQIFIWIKDTRSKFQIYGMDYEPSCCFKYFRILLFLINISSIICAIIVVKGFSNMFDSKVAIFVNPNIASIFAYGQVVSTSIAAILLIISLCLVNRPLQNQYSNIPSPTNGYRYYY